jgi:hypothetical protein
MEEALYIAVYYNLEPATETFKLPLNVTDDKVYDYAMALSCFDPDEIHRVRKDLSFFSLDLKRFRD